jgi:hypothetical protein
MVTIVSRAKRLERVKLPWLAALLNFILPGFGYLYVWGIRFHWKSLFGISLIIVQLLLWRFTAVNTGDLLMIPFSIVFAYDAYRDAKSIEISEHPRQSFNTRRCHP